MNVKTEADICKAILADFDLAKQLSEADIGILLSAVNDIFLKLPMCIKISKGPAIVVGDIHGDFEMMKKIVSIYFENNIDHLIFLGDIVDRGQNSIACLNLLFSLIIDKPNNVHLIRGNHEALSVNSRYGFINEVGNFGGTKELYEYYNGVFSHLSLSLLHEQFRYFFVHGGIPDSPILISDIDALSKGDVLLSDPTIMQLLWNDPKEGIGRISYSMRGEGIFTFGEELVDEFLTQNDLRMIIRAHEAFEEGYKYFFDKKLLSLFSSEEYYNYVDAKIAFINSQGIISVISPSRSNTILR